MSHFNFADIAIWMAVVYLLGHLPTLESRVDEMELKVAREPPSPTEPPEPPKVEENSPSCFHMPRSACPVGPNRCVRVDPSSVFCCDVDSAKLKEGLTNTMNQNVTNLHVLNGNIDELDISYAGFRRLRSMAFTDGNIGNLAGQFPKYTTIACLNISNNNLTSQKMKTAIRPFYHLYNKIQILDLSSNNLTEFPPFPPQKKIFVDFSGNNNLPCKSFQKAMEGSTSSQVTFLNYNKTYCALNLAFNWFNDSQIVKIEHVKLVTELNARCQEIKPAGINCECVPERLELMGDGVTNLVAVDCSNRSLRELPTNLPTNTVKLNVSYNQITSVQAVGDDPSYEHVRQLFLDYNALESIVELEGTKFIDNFMLFSISHNKLKTIHTYVLSNKFDVLQPYTTFSIAGNYIHCDCNTEKVLKPWLLENFKNIPDFKSLMCQDNMGPVVDLIEFEVCHTPRDWTDYIYFVIALEVMTLALLISKVSYDYWVFKTAGYLPWPANKMPRLPCDWLCE